MQEIRWFWRYLFHPNLNSERIGRFLFVTEDLSHEVVFAYFWRKILREAIMNFFAENVVRGNAVQIFSNFPAKSLSI